MLTLNETKLDYRTIDSSIKTNQYSILRRDNSSREGGLLVLIKKCYDIVKFDLGEANRFQIDYIYFQLRINKQKYNFITCYKAPHISDLFFLDELEELIYSFDNNHPLFIIGDLNMNLYNDNNINLARFLSNNGLVNFVKNPTRTKSKYYSRHQSVIESSTSIDLVLHNMDLVVDTQCIFCPFSDHDFVQIDLKLIKITTTNRFIFGRNLSQCNLNKITDLINKSNISIDNNVSTNENWLHFKNKILNIIDEVAPVKKIMLRCNDNFPWVDDELLYIKFLRDSSYKKYKKTNDNEHNQSYKEFRDLYYNLYNDKMVLYFRDKSIRDFKNSKKFWEFYSSYIKIKSDKSSQQRINSIKNGPTSADSDFEISNLFNSFFTSLKSSSTINHDDSIEFIHNTINKNKKTNVPSFQFKVIENKIVMDLILDLDNSSGPGVSEISTKIFKAAINKICPILTKLFNDCISTCLIPTEWKTAIVTPLYKNSGAIDDINNYRGISVLPPVVKVFERAIACQITEYLNNYKMLFECQYGFRLGHSCESALHQILTCMKKILSDRTIGLYLFVDFKKAFDLVNPVLLIHKLEHGFNFDRNAIRLIKDYFKNRSQYTKVNGIISNNNPVMLGVPQGSVLGPLFFLLYINDLAYYLADASSVLFADDTTIYFRDSNLTSIIAKFNKTANDLINWCKYNQLDINFNKTKVMFVTNKRENYKKIILPKVLRIEENEIEVVKSFKLLGIIINDDLNFNEYIGTLRRKVNQRLYSIKGLFFLSLRVKIQFLKTFILPYFDYCSSLIIYFSREIIQKLANSYNNCIFNLIDVKKLLNTQINLASDFNLWNNKLEKYGLNAFQHRIIMRLSTYIYKIFTDDMAPAKLKLCFVYNSQLNKPSGLRNLNSLAIPSKSKFNDHMESTFEYFFSKFINEIFLKIFKKKIYFNEINFNTFKLFIYTNINLIFLNFIEIFKKFDLKFKLCYLKN